MESTAEGKILRAIGSQKFSICAGPMPLIMFDVEGASASNLDAIDHFRASVKSNLEVLDPRQRPNPMFFGCPTQIQLNDTCSKLAVRLPLDGMSKIPHLMDPDLHYEVLSKRGLAQSTFTTPGCQILDLGTDNQIYEQQLRYKQMYCPGNPLPEEVVQTWKNDVLETILTRPLPFVVKLQQTIFGKGTFIVKTSNDRAELLSRLPAMLQHNLSRTNVLNLHLRPATIIVSDFVTCSANANISYAITFFVGRDGIPDFICCVTQNMSEDNCWEGASITFSDQDRLERRFSKTIHDVASYINSKGYYGTIGIDVLEDVKGTQWVVDMNVRPPGSLILGLLKGFLSRDRGFDESQLISVLKTTKGKEEVLEMFGNEVVDGSIIITAWFKDVETGINWTSFVISGDTKADVQRLANKLQMLK
ncbi:hypothetical protein BGZ57DRAFT_778277 [Hyaloscypha finlandica]|nr:hypothetical protein BGZ57DRAFT_778277 [Hyaloscypha finlandica]